MNSRIVSITHMVNPSLFFCCDLSLLTEEKKTTDEIEKRLAELSKTATYREFYVPRAGDVSLFALKIIDNNIRLHQIVAFYFRRQKWIRCEVDHYSLMSNQHVIILWAIDYGAPLYTSNFDDIFQIPMNVVFPKSKIFKAGLGVLPARIRFESTNCTWIQELSKVWTDRSVDDFSMWLEEVDHRGLLLQFTPSSKFGQFDHFIGDLVVFENDLLSYGMSTKLLQAGYAQVVADYQFQKQFNRIDTRFIERWNDNSRAGGVLKKPEGVIRLIPLDVANLTKLDMDAGILPADFLEEIKQRVLKWQEANNGSDRLDLISVSSDNNTIIGTGVEPPANQRLLAKKLDEMNQKELANSEQRKDVSNLKKKEKGESICLAAGASIQCTPKAPIRENYELFQGNSTFDDEEFISVSEVDCSVKTSFGNLPSLERF